MVLSYEDAPLGDAMPYFSCRLAPLPITTFVGRSAKRHPACPAKETVFWWFKDEYLVSASPRTHTHISLHAEPFARISLQVEPFAHVAVRVSV